MNASPRRDTLARDDRTPARRRGLILVALGLTQLMVSLDTTILTIALPSAQADLGFTDEARQWAITGYALAFGSLMLLTGRLADRYGRRRILLIGLAGFGIASAAAGAAPSFVLLVAARVVQGVFAALLAPAALSILSTTFTEPTERARAFGIFGSVSMLGTTIGLLLGGALTELLSWRWTMYINLVLAVPALVLAATLITRQAVLSKQKLDWAGTFTVTLGLFGLVLGTSQSEASGWASPNALIPLGAATILLIAFVLIQRTAENPLLPLRIVSDRMRAGALTALLLSSAGLFTTFLLLPFYLQGTLGYGQLQTGLAFLPVPVALALSATLLTPLLARRLGTRTTIPAGLALAGIALALLTRLTTDSGYTSGLLPSLILLGTGIGMVIATATSAATDRVGTADAGAAAALVNTAQQAGGSVGVAVLNTVVAATTAAALPSLSPAHAAVQGYTTGFAWSAGIFLAGSVLTLVTLASTKGRS